MNIILFQILLFKLKENGILFLSILINKNCSIFGLNFSIKVCHFLVHPCMLIGNVWILTVFNFETQIL